MAKDLSVITYRYLDGADTGITGWPKVLEFAITEGATTQKYTIGIEYVLLTLDVDANYMEIRTDSAVIYKYAPGDTFNTGVLGTAEAMYGAIQGFMFA